MKYKNTNPAVVYKDGSHEVTLVYIILCTPGRRIWKHYVEGKGWLRMTLEVCTRVDFLILFLPDVPFPNSNFGFIFLCFPFPASSPFLILIIG